MPSEADLEIIRRFSGDVSKLDKPEQFFIATCQVPRLTAKLDVFLFVQQFDSLCSTVVNRAKQIVNSCEKVSRENIKKIECSKGFD